MTGRREYVLDIAGRMWPGPAFIGRPEQSDQGEEGMSYLLIPSAREPRLMLPVASRHAAAAAVQGFAADRAGLRRQRATLLAATVRSGLGPLLFRDRLIVRAGGIEGFLADVLGRQVRIGMQIGPPRANRKPVLHLSDDDGAELGYAKIATDELTTGLLIREAEALDRLNAVRHRGLSVPAKLHLCSWNGLHVLVISSLPVRSAKAAPPRQAHGAMRTIVHTGHCATRRADSWDYLRELVADLHRLPGAGPEIGADLGRLVAAYPDLYLSSGAWHGDLTPWNCALADSGTVLVWDWERYHPEVPVGYDALHHRFQAALHRRTPHQADVQALVAGAPSLLLGFSVAALGAQFTALAYLGEIARRWLRDRQHEAGAQIGDLQRWLTPGLHACVEDLVSWAERR